MDRLRFIPADDKAKVRCLRMNPEGRSEDSWRRRIVKGGQRLVFANELRADQPLERDNATRKRRCVTDDLHQTHEARGLIGTEGHRREHGLDLYHSIVGRDADRKQAERLT